MAKHNPITQELQRTETQLSFLETRDRKTVGNTLLAVAIAVGVVLFYGVSVVSELYELRADFTLPNLGNFLGSSLLALLYPSSLMGTLGNWGKC